MELSILPSKCQHIHLKTKMNSHEVTLCTKSVYYWFAQFHNMRLKPKGMIVNPAPQPLVLRVVNFFCQTMGKWSKINSTIFLHLHQRFGCIPTARSISRRLKLRLKDIQIQQLTKKKELNCLFEIHFQVNCTLKAFSFLIFPFFEISGIFSTILISYFNVLMKCSTS